MILKEFDNLQKAVINPEDIISIKIKTLYECPKIAISCFSFKTFEKLVKDLNAEEIEWLELENANNVWKVYKAKYNGIEVLIFMSIVGAAACVAVLEELHAVGVEKFIIFGTCGVLDKNIKDLSIIIPDSAIRDEGTSYHYKESSDEVEVNKKYICEFKEILEERNIDYTVGKVWTTDAFYRETHSKVARRKKQGAIAVDMECSAVAAFAEFRNVEVFYFFYSADNLDSKKWECRSLANCHRLEEKGEIAYLALLLAEKIHR